MSPPGALSGTCNARTIAVFRWDGRSIGLYDGSKDVSGHFEEHCGLAFSSDSPTWRGVSAD